MLERRHFLALIAGGFAVAAMGSTAEAKSTKVAPAPAPEPDMPTTTAELRDALTGSAGEPTEMQWGRRRRRWVVRRRVWVVRRRRVWIAPRRRRYWGGPRVVRRCWWTGWGTACRWVRVW